MTEQEVKDKIKNLLSDNMRWQPYYAIMRGIVYEQDLDKLADALIAAGIGDVKRHRVFVSKDGKEVKQFYSGEEVENILKERNELKVELRDKVDYIHEQDEVIKEYKHRAQVAERALCNALNDDSCYFCNKKSPCECEHRDWGSKECITVLLRQAEKELAEEGDDDSRGNDEGE